MKKILLSIAISSCVFLLLKLLLPDLPNDEASIKHFWLSKTFSGSEYDVVIAGDSRVYRGVSPNDLIDGLGNADMKAINLGYSSAGFSSAYLDFVKSKFDPNAKNKILVLGVTPHSLTTEAFKNEHLKSFLAYSQKEQFKLIHLYRLLKPFSPYKLSDITEGDQQNYQQNYTSSGWVASSYLVPDSALALESYQKVFESYQVRQEEVSLFIDEVKNLIKDHYTVIAFNPPSTVAMHQLEESMSGVDMEEVAKKLQGIGVHWLTFSPKAYNSYDGSHLDEKAAKKFSFEIGIRIRQILNQ
ncbi:hypothetical protein [Parvicella tangerina]|uniref:Uncharacterized protein n=1 Tax=Parvicella tangerina TaxID=2829795 RepID=A0A916JLI9_9FLAO|nr:hypothetical protein [Parvicella tangerina]CAG5080969.1 hypothetical protein CRYO30217_01499 [Parvicella tangerina]